MRKVFGFPNLKNLRYSNCWEDTDVLLSAMPEGKSKKFLSILSGGDNSFSLLTLNPEKVTGVDFCFEQTAVCHLKKAAIKHLEYNNVLKLLGFRQCRKRHSIYLLIRQYMPDDIADFWDNNADILNEGILYAGRFENYFMIFAKYIIPVLFTRKKVHMLFAEMNSRQRHDFYYRSWDSPLYKTVLKMFFSRRLMAMLGRDPAFFRHVEGGISKHIKKRVDNALSRIPASSNPYLHFIMFGHFGNILPHYLKKENFRVIKRNIDRLEINKCGIEDVLNNVEFDGYNLSDIFEYMDEEQTERIYRKLLGAGKRGCRFVYWNMMVPREAPEVCSKDVKRIAHLESKLYAMNKAFFYERLVIEEKI